MDLSVYSIRSSVDESPTHPPQAHTPTKTTSPQATGSGFNSSPFNIPSTPMSPDIFSSPLESMDRSPPRLHFTDLHSSRNNNLPLPCHSNFATERAKAIRKKRSREHTSPFKLSHHANSDFVKSSSLLESNRSGRSTGRLAQKEETVCKHTAKLAQKEETKCKHKQKTRQSNHSPHRRIKRARMYGWPSSSESSSSDDDQNIASRKRSNISKTSASETFNLSNSTMSPRASVSRKYSIGFQTPPRSSLPVVRLHQRNNPFDQKNDLVVVDLTTPDSERAVRQIAQMQKDEEMAKKLQEELDKEFALSLAQQQEQRPERYHTPEDETVDVLSSNLVTPPAYRGLRGRNRPAGNRRAARHAGAQLLQFTDLLHDIHSELGIDMNHLSGLQRNVHRARRRGGFSMMSPGANGENYDELLRLEELIGDAKEKGLSKGQINCLPTVAFQSSNNKGSVECHICMCEYEEGDTQKLLPCFHSFHAKCIDKWIVKNASCPVCRVEIKLDRSPSL